jgi:hypothetical protein
MNFSKRLNYFSTLALTSVLTLLSNTSHADSSQRWVSVNVGKKSDVVIAPKESTKVINFVLFSTKKTASTLNINLTAPKNARLSAKSLGVSSKSTLESALGKLKSMHTLEVAAAGGKLTRSVVVGASVVGGSNGDAPGGYRMICDGQASTQFLPQMIQEFKDKCQRTHRSEQDLCDGIFRDDAGYDCKVDPGAGSGGGTGSGDSGGGSSTTMPTLTATSHVFKNACNPKSKYVVVLSVDLSKVSASQKASGYTISLDLVETAVSGSQPATVKFGDGKYKTWILLAPVVSFGNKHGYQVWSGSTSAMRLVSSTTESMKKYYGMYGISIAARHLRGGGRMTVSVFDTQKNYGLCLRRGLGRQCINGYKGGDCK